jgi:hypothetical protein
MPTMHEAVYGGLPFAQLHLPRRGMTGCSERGSMCPIKHTARLRKIQSVQTTHQRPFALTRNPKQQANMRVNGPLLGLSLAATAAAAQPLLYVTNQCPENVYVVYSNDQYKAAQVTLTKGKGFQVILSGLGTSPEYLSHLLS